MSDSEAGGPPHIAASNVMAALMGADAADEFEHKGWRFLCSGEQLPGGGFHAVVRCRTAPSDSVRTLRMGQDRFDTASSALEQAKALAVQWVDVHPGPPNVF